MLDGRRDNVSFRGVGLNRGMNRRVIALGGARREDDLAWTGPDEFRNLSPGLLDYRFQL